MKKSDFFAQLFEFVIKAVLDNPVATAILVLALIVLAVAWFYSQVEETRTAEAERIRDRGYGDSIWND
jgi:plastocyanin domain-containing protein